MSVDTGRRNALLGFSSVALGAAALAAGPARAEAGSSVVPQGAHAFPELIERLRKAPRKRDFKTVPMIRDRPDLWDDTALKEVIAYRGKPGRQIRTMAVCSFSVGRPEPRVVLS